MTADMQPAPFAQALDFTGKTVLVTGGGVGIGRAIAEAFCDAGAHVVIAEIDPARADHAEAAMSGARVIRCDVRQRGVGAMLAERIGAETGKLDVLVNNVGHFVNARPFAMLADEEADEIVDTNLGQMLRMTRAMIPLLRKGGAGSSIINVTSIEAHRGIPYCSVYAAAKWAVTGFTKSLALELGPEGYALGADRRDKALWREVLADDVEITGPGFAISGLEANLGSIDHLTHAFTATRHIVHDMDVIVNGDSAEGETRSTAEHRMATPEGDRLLVWAIRYEDQWRREGDSWKFTRRALIVDWEELRPLKGTLA